MTTKSFGVLLLCIIIVVNLSSDTTYGEIYEGESRYIYAVITVQCGLYTAYYFSDIIYTYYDDSAYNKFTIEDNIRREAFNQFVDQYDGECGNEFLLGSYTLYTELFVFDSDAEAKEKRDQNMWDSKGYSSQNVIKTFKLKIFK